MSLTCGPGQRSAQAGSKLGRLGLDTGWALARHVARAGAATSSYWATNGSWSMGAGEARFMVNPPVLVHRPQSRSMKDLVHFFPGFGSCAPSARMCGRRGENPLLLPRRAPAGGELPSEPLRRYWCAIKVGKSIAKPRRVQWWGHGGSWGFLGFWPR